MAGSVGARLGACALLVLLVVPCNTWAALLPPRLSSPQSELWMTEGQVGNSLECVLDVGDDPISYRWLKDNHLVTGSLGYAYRGYRRVFLALHPVEKQHAGTYVCEASNEAGVHSHSIRVFVEKSDSLEPANIEQPTTDEILSDIATSLSDVLAEGECKCDTLFLLHASTDAPAETLQAQANLIHTIADSIISESTRVSVMTYSDYTSTKLPFGRGIHHCALRDAFSDLSHKKWTTRIQPVLKEVFKRFMKSKANCKVLFLPIFGSLGTEGADIIEAHKLKKIDVKIFILEVTPEPLESVMEMASKRGDGQPYHWRIPLDIWPTIVMYMKYITEELVGCMPQVDDIPGLCVGAGSECTAGNMCRGAGFDCIDGRCQLLQCNVNSRQTGCCSLSDQYWCGDVTNQCTPTSSICDGLVQCMNGADEDRCWSNPCPENKIARCQSSTLCLDLMDLCDGKSACPGGEDEDPRFCRSFPCPTDRPFRCRSGKCIDKLKLCDGIFKDCEEGEDEDLEYCNHVHNCPETHPFKCDYGICIAERMLCDGSYNCLDATDELVCGRRSCPVDRPFKCLSGLCISMDKVCNGVMDGCDDGHDENNCTEISCPVNRNFKCTNGRCIDGWLICNTRDDCGDGSDELNCEPSTTPSPLDFEEPACREDEFLCDSGACVSNFKVCDGRKHCPNGEDETNCQSRPCPLDRPHRCGDGTCVVSAPPCDGIHHCGDKSDEINCTFTEEKDEDELLPDEYYEDIDDDYGIQDYDEYGDYEEDHLIPIEEPVLSTTSTTLPPILIEPKEQEDTVPEVNVNKDVVVESTTMKHNTKVEDNPVEGNSVSEEETELEQFPEEVEKQPPQETHEHYDDTDDDDVEDVETILEEIEPADVRPAASSEQGVSSGPCVLPVCTLIIAPMFVISFRYVWTR